MYFLLLEAWNLNKCDEKNQTQPEKIDRFKEIENKLTLCLLIF